MSNKTYPDPRIFDIKDIIIIEFTHKSNGIKCDHTRTITFNSKQLYFDSISMEEYAKGNSPLRQFEKWLIKLEKENRLKNE
jgi:hypothetical protein